MAKNIMEVKLNIDADRYQKFLNETIKKVEELEERLERLNHPNIYILSKGDDTTIFIAEGEKSNTVQIGELCIKSGTIDAHKFKELTVDQISNKLAEKLRKNI